ncbi:MAG: enoyl-CoA hydratase/isomerase family protein [Dehalococcoidia bacterium]
MSNTVLTQQNEHVLLITLNRPEKLNAISSELSEALGEALRLFDRTPELRAAVLTGAGRAFCAGRDLVQRAGESVAPPTVGSELEDFLGTRPDDRFSTWSTNKPIIAAVNGHCLGGGFELALCCDIRIASDQASFGLPEITRGFFPGGGGPQRIGRAAPQSAAMELLLTGDPIDAMRALEIGIVSRVTSSEALLPTAMDLASRIARNAPLAVRAAKELYQHSQDLPLAESLRFGAALRWMVQQTDDAKEGPLAFKEKRLPDYKGQ